MTKIIDKNIVEQYTSDIKEYALYVNTVRMMPNVLDGLKQIHRRIIYGAWYYEKATGRKVKSSAIVGTVIKTMHPHGDAAVYESMKPLTNNYEINMPLLLGKGNWGTFQGDGSAASRYTESGISPFCLDTVISELKDNKNVIDWKSTYDNRNVEPENLPTAVPLLLINGAFGIGYGIKVEIPRHNLNDVLDATIELIKNPEAKVVLIPEQCQPCEIIEANFKSISNLGHGKFTVRGIIEVCEYQNKPALRIKSCPDLVFLNTVTKKIEDLINEKKLIGIVDMVEDSSVDQMNYIIVLKKGTDPNYVKDTIYKNTQMEKNFNVNFEALDQYNPIRLSYKAYLQSFIENRKLIKFRYYCNLHQIVETKIHKFEAYIKTLQTGEIDEILNTIRQQTNINDTQTREYLISRFGITDLQATYIMECNVKKISFGYLQQCLVERENLIKEKNDYLNKILNDNAILDEIIEELNSFKIKYGSPRKCTIIKKSDVDHIPKGFFKIVITENNFIKKVPENGSIGSFKGDNPKFVIKTNNDESILLYDEQGRVFKIATHKIPVSILNSNGVDIRTLIKKLTSNICAVMHEPTLSKFSKSTNKYFITILTKNGNIKKLDIEDFLATPASGILYIKLDPDDFVKNVSVIAHGLDIIVYSKNKALRMNIDEIPHQKRNNKGMRAITESEVDGLSIIFPSTTDIVTITKNGYVNRTHVSSLPNLGRNKSGSNVIKLHKDDCIYSILGLTEDHTMHITTKNDKFSMKVSDIQTGSSLSTGKKILSLKNDNIIHCSVSK